MFGLMVMYSPAHAESNSSRGGDILHVQMTPAICALDPNRKKQRKCLEGYALTVAGLVPETMRAGCETNSSAILPPLQAKVVARIIPDEASRIQYIGLVNIGANFPPDIEWKTMDGSFVNMTLSIAQTLIGTTAISDNAVFSAAEKHKAEMMKLANPLDYDFSAGWPIAFWER